MAVVRVGNGRSRAVFAAVLLAVTGCMTGDDSALLSSDGNGEVLDEFEIAGLGADPTGGSWVLGRANSGLVAHRFSEGDGLTPVSNLSDWTGLDMHVLDNGQLAVVGVRCSDSPRCEGALSEIVLVSSDGVTSEPNALTTRQEGGPQEDTDVPLIIGEVDDLLWVHDFTGDLVAVNSSGEIEHRIPRPAGALCAADGQLYMFSSSGQRPPTDEVVDYPPPDPVDPPTIEVSVFNGEAFEPMSGHTVEVPSGAVGRCTPDGYEMSGHGEVIATRWTRSAGWSEDQSEQSPSRSRSTNALGSRADEFVVDGNGRLLMRDLQGAWKDTPIVFSAIREDDQPPLPLFADHAAGSLLACMSIGAEDAGSHGLECHESDEL